jgi:hypothetical protein
MNSQIKYENRMTMFSDALSVNNFYFMHFIFRSYLRMLQQNPGKIKEYKVMGFWSRGIPGRRAQGVPRVMVKEDLRSQVGRRPSEQLAQAGVSRERGL